MTLKPMNGTEAVTSPGAEEVHVALYTEALSVTSKTRKRKERSATTRPIVYKTTRNKIEELKAYRAEHGHLNVKQRENRILYEFCCRARVARKTPDKSTVKLTADRIAQLDAIGFNWVGKRKEVPKITTSSKRMRFEDKVEELKAYRAEHGHFKVEPKENKSLYNFCHTIRAARKTPDKSNRKLTADRIAQLDAIGFNWDINGTAGGTVAPLPLATNDGVSSIAERALQRLVSLGKVSVEDAEEAMEFGIRSGRKKPHSHHHIDDVPSKLLKKGPAVLALSSRPPRWTENEVSRYNQMFNKRYAHIIVLTLTQTFPFTFPYIVINQDEQLRKIVQYLHPQIAESIQIQPEQIRDIHWTQVSDKLHDAKSSNTSKVHGSGDKSSSSYSYTRKPAECMRRYTKLRGAAKGGAEKAGASKGPWTDEEDRKVIELVQTHGPKKWSQIASELPGKTGTVLMMVNTLDDI
jgi:hypothetical protein